MKWSSKLENISKIGIANIAGSVISVGLWFIIAGMLQTEKYGELSYLLSIGGIVATVCLIGGPQAIVIFSAKKIQIQGTIYVTSFITSIISAVILYVFLQNLEIGIFVIGSVIYNLTIAELLGRRTYSEYSKLFLIQKILQFVLAIGLFFILNQTGVILGVALSFLVMLKYFFKTIKENGINFTLLKEKIVFVMNIYLRDLGRALNGNIDKILIGPMFGFSLLGNYYLGLQVLSLLSIVPGIVSNFVIPEEAAGNSTKRIKLYTILLSFILAILGFFVAPLVIPHVFPQYQESVTLIPILSLAVIPSTISSMLISSFLSQENSKPIIIGYAISILVLVLSIMILGTKFDVLGIAIAYVLGQTSYAVFLICIKKYAIITK
ncbi:hypothetical protein [Nitrosarchaeum sp.]|uniref:lipopolysaccharide biosynthesis protein n=1 Tax=Nitrosarchaeum sp. TaxID=2026886 RepID=UPI00247DE599|nr:hypothetical protein [Nitrosarchaeum sp.]MCV0411886.1 hypothetical protein [Nitrosarchaeum sp.]